MAQVVSANDKISNSVNAKDTAYNASVTSATPENVSSVTSAVNAAKKQVLTIVTPNETIVKDADYVTISSVDQNGKETWVVGQ